MYRADRAGIFSQPLFSFIFMTGLCGGGFAQVAKNPTTQSVLTGETAVFNCSLACSGTLTPVTWYLTTPDTGRSIAISPYTFLAQIKAVYGVDLTRRSVDECLAGGYRVEQLIVNKPSRLLNMMPVQCATLCLDACPCTSVQVYFSKYALLLVSEPATSTSVPAVTANVTSIKYPLQTPSASPAPY